MVEADTHELDMKVDSLALVDSTNAEINSGIATDDALRVTGEV